MAQLAMEITVKGELRPAVVCYSDFKGTNRKIEVLVHTAHVSEHGGFVVEDANGLVFEVVPMRGTELRFVDNRLSEYVFLEEEKHD